MTDEIKQQYITANPDKVIIDTIELKYPENGKIIIDFNQSYNPYCAYNHKYSCPIPPKENFIDIEIKAGVKKFH